MLRADFVYKSTPNDCDLVFRQLVLLDKTGRQVCGLITENVN